MFITAALALGLACRAPTPSASLLLVTLDTTRADHIGAYGASNAHTPNIDQLAKSGLRLERAYATVPLTIPSHASMFTGLYPDRHGVHTNGDAVLAPSLDTLAERLQAAGYRTGASVSAFVTNRMWGLNQGFDAYFDDLPPRASAPARWGLQRPADAVVADASAWLQAGQGPYFLWVHLYDAHDPHTPPEPWASRMPETPYDAEIAFMDEQLGRLLPIAEAAAGPGGLHVIALGDHGESLGEVRGEPAHGLLLAEATTRVPFVVRPAKPLDEAKVESGFAASVADLGPTALGLLGLPVPAGLDGVDLSPLLRGRPLTRDGVYQECWTPAQRFGYAPEIAWIELPFKLLNSPRPRLYDLLADPREAHDLAAARGEDLRRLQAKLAQRGARAAPADGAAVPPEVSQMLEALGYMGGELVHSEVDLRDHLDTIEALARARQLEQRDRAKGAAPADAEALYREILAKEPDLREAILQLAEIREARGDRAEARALLERLLALQPDSTVARTTYAGILARGGDTAAAIAQLEQVLAAVPRDDAVRAQLQALLLSRGETEQVLALARAWQADGTLSPTTAAQPALILQQRGARDAREMLLFSLSDGIARPGVQEALALDALAGEDAAAAMDWLRRELESWPQNLRARALLARELMRAGEWEEAAAEYQYLSEADPEDVDLCWARAQAIFNTADYERAAEVLAPALTRAPENPRVLLLQANILARQGRVEEGRVLAERAKALAEAGASP